MIHACYAVIRDYYYVLFSFFLHVLGFIFGVWMTGLLLIVCRN